MKIREGPRWPQPNPVVWRHENPLTGARGETVSQGYYTQKIEPDSMGVDVGFADPYNIPPEETHDPDLASLYPGTEFGGRCRVEGIQFDCAWALRMLNSGVATRCPNDDCGARPIFTVDESGRQTAAGWKVPLSGGWWAGNGEANEDGDDGFVFFDDVQYGTPLEASAMFLTSPQKRKRRKRGSRFPVKIVGGISGGSTDRLPGTDMTACKVMADHAQGLAEAADLFHSNTSLVPGNRLENFDSEFSKLYHGGPIRSYADAQRVSPGNLREIPAFFASNGSGFQEQFRDTGTEPDPIGGRMAEQTHHFSFNLSVGINGRWDIYQAGQWGVRPALRWPQADNEGARRLGRAAYTYGGRLSKHPEELMQIGAWIRKNICTSEGVGLYGF